MNTWEYIKSDLIRYTGRYSFYILLNSYLRHSSFKYSFWLRLCKHNNFLIRTIAILMHKILSGRYLIQIPRSIPIGYGLYIAHHMCIVVGGSAKIGNNVNLSQFTTIGSNDGKEATIGNNVYIGPNVCIVGDVVIGNNSTIGAGSVVTKDVQENATVAGVPAKFLSFNNPGRYILNRWKE